MIKRLEKLGQLALPHSLRALHESIDKRHRKDKQEDHLSFPAPNLQLIASRFVNFVRIPIIPGLTSIGISSSACDTPNINFSRNRIFKLLS